MVYLDLVVLLSATEEVENLKKPGGVGVGAAPQKQNGKERFMFAMSVRFLPSFRGFLSVLVLNSA